MWGEEFLKELKEEYDKQRTKNMHKIQRIIRRWENGKFDDSQAYKKIDLIINDKCFIWKEKWDSSAQT